MKQLYITLLLLLGLAGNAFAKNSADSLASVHAKRPVAEKLELYREHLQHQNAEENAFYHSLINQLNNSFQAKALQTRYTKTSSLIYSVLIVVLSAFSIYLIFNIRRILKLYRIEKQNREKTQELLMNTEDINTIKARFLQDISYKIRTPLNSVMGLSEILANNPELIEAEDVKCISETIQNNSQELQQLVNAVLDLSRLESGMMKYSLSDYSLAQICQDAISIVRLHSDTPIPPIGFNCTVEEGRDTIHTDVTRLTQILSEMLHTPLHKVEQGEEENVCINLSVCKENGAFLQVEVKHSPMTRNADEDSLNSIRQKIAQLLIEHFGGTFSIQSEDILFTYPLK